MAATNAFGRMARGAAAFGITLGAIGFIAAGRHALEFAANLGETSRQIGTTVEQLQILQRIALANNVSTEGMERSIARLTRTLGEAKAGTASAIASFTRLGITPAQINSFEQGGDVLRTVAERIMRIPDPARQAAAAFALFGRQGQQLLPTLAAIARDYDRVGEEARRLGLLTDEQAAKADDANDKLAALAYTLRSRLAIAITDNIGPITSLINAFAGLIQRLRQVIPLATAFAGIALGSRFGPWGAAIGGTLGLLGGNAAMSDANQGRAAMARQQRDTRLRSLGAAAPGDRSFERRGGVSNPAFQRAMRDPAVLRFHRDARMADRAAAQASATSGVPALADMPGGDLDYSTGGAGGGRGGGGTDRAKEERERRLREEAEFQSELRGFRADILRAQQDQVSNADTRNEIELQILGIEREDYQAQLALQVGLEELTQARADELKLAYDQVFEERQQSLRLEQRRYVDEQINQTEQARFSVLSDALRQESDLAHTASERRDVEMRLLDLAYRQEQARLRAVIADDTSSGAAVAEAELRLAALDQWRDREGQAIRQRTQGPIESFLDTLPTTAARANEALQQVAVGGLQSIEDGLVAILSGTKSVGAAFRDMASSILSDLIRIQIQRLITIPLSNALSGMLGGGFQSTAGQSIPGIFQAIAGVASAGAGKKVPGFATGGSFVVGGVAGVDRNMLSLNGQPIARVSRGEPISIGSGRGGQRLQIVPSPYFDVVVDGRVINTGAPMVAAGMTQARTGAQVDLHRRAGRRIP